MPRIATVALTVVAGVLAVVAVWQWREAEEARAIAVREAEDARLAKQTAEAAEKARKEADEERQKALQAKHVSDEQKQRAAQDAVKARQEVEAARENLARLNYAHSLARARAEWRESNVGLARELLEGSTENLRGWEWRYLQSGQSDKK